MAGTRRFPRKESASSRASSGRADTAHRIVITVCPRERGVVVLPVERGGRRRRLDAAGVARSLRDLVTARGFDAHVSVREGCAGGCARAGPNVDVRIHSMSPAGAKMDTVAIDWKTYVYSLASLDCLASIIEDNLYRRSRDEWSG